MKSWDLSVTRPPGSYTVGGVNMHSEGCDAKANHDIIATIFDTRDAKLWRYHNLYSISARLQQNGGKLEFILCNLIFPRSYVPDAVFRYSGRGDRRRMIHRVPQSCGSTFFLT
jgi:hypothetical protein